MQVIIVNSDRELVFSEESKPQITSGYVLIQVKAFAVNRADLLQVDGNYPSPPDWPNRPGLECAGIIAEASAGSRFKTGDNVCALLGGGGYAEYCLVPEDMVMFMPKNLSFEEAAGIPEVFATVYLNFMYEAKMQGGETVFIQAGASGIGLAAIQFCKMKGCKVITSVGNDEKAEYVRQLGADFVINYHKELLKPVLEANPPDIVLDCVGGADMGTHFSLMAPWGRWIQIANLAGRKAEMDLDIVFRKRLRLIGSTLRSRTNQVKGEILQDMQKKLWPAFSTGQLKVHIYKTLPWQQANEAHAILRNNANIGKVILAIRGK